MTTSTVTIQHKVVLRPAGADIGERVSVVVEHILTLSNGHVVGETWNIEDAKRTLAGYELDKTYAQFAGELGEEIKREVIAKLCLN